LLPKTPKPLELIINSKCFQKSKTQRLGLDCKME